MSVVLYRVSAVNIEVTTWEPATEKWAEYFFDLPSARHALDKHSREAAPDIITTEAALEEVLVERRSLEARTDYDDDDVPVLILRLGQLKILDSSVVDRWKAQPETIKTKIERLKQLKAERDAAASTP
jgi:hypothetical protein